MPLVAPAISFQVALNATSANLMAGSLYEILARPSIVEFGMTASAVGILATVMLGGEVLVQDQEISAANRYPIVPDDWILKAAGRAGAPAGCSTLAHPAGGKAEPLPAGDPPAFLLASVQPIKASARSMSKPCMRSVTSARCDTAFIGSAPRTVAFFAAVGIAKHSMLGFGRTVGDSGRQWARCPRFPRSPMAAPRASGCPGRSVSGAGSLGLPPFS